MFASPLSRALVAPKKRGVSVSVAAAAAARLPLADTGVFVRAARESQQNVTTIKTKSVRVSSSPLPSPLARSNRNQGRAGLIPLPSRERAQLADLQTAHRALQTQYKELERTLATAQRELQARDREIVHLRELLAERHDQSPQDQAITDVALESAASTSTQDDHVLICVDQDHEEVPTAAELDWVMEIIEAREAIERNSVGPDVQAHRLAQLASHLEAVVSGAVDLTLFDLTSIEGVLDACGLCEMLTPGTGNCQAYAGVQAATQYCLLELQGVATASPEAAQLLTRLERTTVALKRGIRGSARLCFDQVYGTSKWTLEGLVSETGRDKQKNKSRVTPRAIVERYLDDIATNASDLKTIVPSSEWGCSLTLIEMAKVLGRAQLTAWITLDGFLCPNAFGQMW